ncbi:MAG: type VII secretion protein EssA [Streptococcaceae bacterium]|nr:type VII secretion protein EssA [Streptococcaceae bacterium]MCL2681199.1 type VII secretion protein EssA [Streptococcaceae bacterium]MCL2858643.1 type VII secretion protein EssA [Streptococcaceae bacterium]
MKKIKFILFLAVISFLLFPITVLANGDGSLILNSNMITNQSAGTGTVSDFPIRSQLFSQELTTRANEKNQAQANVEKQIESVDFKKDSMNTLYIADYQNLQTKLFHHYNQINVDSSDTNTQAKNNEIIIILIVAVPLMILTGFVARRWARRATATKRFQRFSEHGQWSENNESKRRIKG